jgi:hypothetical protein
MFDISKFARGFGETLHGGAIGRTMMPGPLELFAKEQRGKLARFVKDKDLIGKEGAPGLIDSYFAGRNLTMRNGDIGFTAADEVIGKGRRIAAWGAGGLLAANAFMPNAFGVTDAANNLAALGTHGVIGSTMYKMGGAARIAGIGYLGATAVNTFRRGDNTGPM